MYSEIPPLFMYTNEPVKLILKSRSAPRFTGSLPINFLFSFCGPCFRRTRSIFPSVSFLFYDFDLVAPDLINGSPYSLTVARYE